MKFGHDKIIVNVYFITIHDNIDYCPFPKSLVLKSKSSRESIFGFDMSSLESLNV